MDGVDLPPGFFSLFAAPGEVLELSLSMGTDAVDLFLGGERIERQGASQWRVVAPALPGRYALRWAGLPSGEARDLALMVGRPSSDLVNEKMGNYRIGPTPAAHPHPDYVRYYNEPRAFYEVSEAAVDQPVSQHFRLGQFLCKQASDFPKFIVLDSRLLILLEGIVETLKQRGYAIDTLGVISAYRTPYYNRQIGNIPNSRHVYGDAFDFFVDADGDGRMDDLNSDGRRDESDVDLLFDIVEALKQQPPYDQLVGGIGRYYPNERHGGYVHVDTRGFKARW